MMNNLQSSAFVAKTTQLLLSVARLRLLLVMLLTLTASTAWAQTWEKATSIAAGDVVLLVCESKKMELSSISTTSTKYGIGVAYTTSPAGAYELTVEAGSTSGTYSLKNGSNYLYWSSGNSLATNTSKSANSSWSITFSNGNATIKNAKDNSRIIGWNASSPRFACYTSSQTAVQLYKKVSTDPCASLAAPIVTTTNITNNSFTLSWNAVAGAESYNVYNYTTDVAENITTTSYTFTELTPNTEYEWEIETVKSTCSKGTTGTTTTRTLATITLSEAGVETGVTGKYVGDSYTLPSTTSQSCGDLEFVGWSTVEINNSASKPASNYYAKGASVTLAANQTFYAVFATKETSGSGTAGWNKVTSISDLEAGATYAISNAATGGNYLSTYAGGNNFPYSTTTICKLVLGGSSNAWTFKINDASSYNNYYLTATSATDKNYLKAVNAVDSYCKFTISFNSGKAIITCTGKNSRNVLQYNSSNNPPIFACYASGTQSAVYLQKYSTGTTITYSDYTTQCTTKTTVSLNPNGGTISDAPWELENGVYKLTTEDESITLPTITRTGYTFGGWATSSGGTKEHNANATITLDGNPVTLYAIWTANTYNITYRDQGDVAFSGTHEVGYPTQHTYGTETTLKGATKTGYTFDGWYKEAACTNIVTTLGATAYTSDITLYAKWTAKPLTNYRTFCDVVCDAYSFHTGTGEKETWLKEAIKCFTEAEGGYEHEWQIKDYIIPVDDKFFVGNYGYFYNDNLGVGGTNGKSRSVVSDWGNMYLAPAMDENDAPGTPRLGHAKGAKGTLRIFEDSNWDNLYVGFIPDGYKLMFGDEEYTLAKTTGTEYRSDVVQYNSTNANKNVSVGVVDADGKYVATNHTQEMRHIFLKDNCGWRNDGAKLAIYYWGVSEGWCGFLKTVPGDETLFEGWIPSNATNLKFVRYNSNQSNPGSWDYENDIWNSTGDLTIDGNLFTITDWGTGTWSTYEKYGQFAMHDNSKSKNWYVHFVPHYVLKYDKNADDATGEMDIQTVAVDADDKGVVVADCGFTRPGYKFKNWRKGNTSTYYVPNGSNTIDLNADIILYAQWEAKNITITWDANGGSVDPTTSTYIYNGTPVVLPTPTRANYIFNGWFTTASGGTKIEDVGTTNKPTDDVTYYAQWTAKETPTFAWSADSYTAALEADNNFPTLNNPNSLSVTYTSSDENVAKIDANGDVILGAVGKTEITATGAETATHKSATTTYKLTVVESNCRWVETDIANINSGDEVVITMTSGLGVTYALPSNQSTGSNPQAISFEIDGNCLKNNASTQYVWIINKDGENLTFESLNHAGYFLNCTNADAGVRVSSGSDKNKIFVIDPTSGYLKNTQTTDARYLGVHNTTYYWYCYKTYSNNTGGQTLKFYKKVCLDPTRYWVTWDANGGQWSDGSTKKEEIYTVRDNITKPADPTREGYRFDGWTPAPTIMPAQNTTFTAKWTEVYKITWYENGVPSYTYVPSDNPVVTWEDNIADCGEKKFYGWTADDTFVSDPTTPPTLISKGTTIAGDVTYYAVYADAEVPANPGYTKVTTISEGTYLIATGETSGNKAYTGKSGSNTYGGSCAVEIENDVISEKPDAAVEVTVTSNGSNFYMHDGTYYLGYTSGNAMTFDTSIQTGNQNIWKLTTGGHIESVNVSGRILQYNSGNPRFACYTSNQQKAYLYKKKTTTYKNFAVSCVKYTITVAPADGTVTTTPADEAGQGQTITVNITPADCKYLTALKYNDGSDHSINISSTSYTFTMPAADVTVTATFADKTATDIEILTSAHRMLMQGSAFVGEQVRITYNNGDKETLNWNDSRLTFTGHNTATLSSQTVTVTYNGCGTQSASYNIEVIDGLGITFWDGDYTETIKYEPGDLVDVDNRIGQNICSGWEFAGWSETKVANESEEYVPVHNFNATEPKTLYAVYAKKKTQWTTIVKADEAKSGAKYVLAYDRYDTYYALTSSVKDVNYLAGKVVTSTEGELNSFDVYYLSAEPTADLIWELVSTGENGKWYLYNKNTAKYIDLSTQGQIHLTDLPSDKLQMESGYNDSQIRIASSTVPTYYLSWDNSNTRYNTYSSLNSQLYWYTKDEEFTSTPPCSPLSATFHGNGGIVTDGVNSGDNLTITEPTRDAGITTPTASFEDCNGKTWTFVGWSDKKVDVTRVPILTTDLLHDGGGNKHYKIQEDGEEFWAIFTNTGESETKYGTITFTDDDVTRQYENAKTITKTVTVMGDYNFELYHVSKASSMGIQFDNNVATKGYIKNITSLGKINSISFNDFQTGDINNVKVYVGNMPNAINTLLTEADLQKTGNTYTYYPQKNYAYVKIESNGYCGITSISIDFGKGTQIWATTPNCSDIFLSSNELYVTSTKGRAVMAPATLTVKANQLEANADVILTSNSSDVYFSTDRTFNFAAGQAANQKPKTSLTLSTDAEGNLATTDVYIHYMPSSEGDGVPADVVISANLEIPNPSISDDHTIHVRNLPAKFVIATKVGATWYALPANMTGETNPLAEVIEVDETTMTATAPNTSTYTLWPVKTTNGTGNRYTDYGDRLRFAAVNYEQRGLWANNNNNSSAIKNYAVINSLGADGTAAYEWKVTTTVVDSHWQYTLQTDQDKNQNFLRYWTSAEGTPVGPKWGTYNAGENKLYFLPVTEAQPFDYDVVEWYPTKVLIQTEAAITSPTVKVGGEKVASPKLTNKGGKLYEISNLPLETNPNKLLQVSFTADAVNYVNAKVVPIILSRGEKTITGEPFTTLTQKVYQYADVVVRDGATLTIDGGTDVANTLLGMTIYPTAKVSVKAGEKLSVHSLTFFGGIDEIYNGSTYEINKYGVPQLSLKGILNKTITNMDYIMRVDLDQMYQVGVPYDVDLYDITYWDGTTMTLGDNLYVSAYDGQKRANLESAWVWEIYWKEEEKVLKAGIGYTISADKQDAAHEYSIIRLPMKSNIASSSTEVAKTVQVFAYANENGVEITDNSKGWNFLSNPYMTAISGAEADSKLVVGRLDRDDVTEPWEWVEKDYRYVTIPSDDGTYHYQQKFKDATLLPFKSFFLQIATSGELSFALESRQNAPARYLQTNNEQREVEFEVLLANDTRSDNLGFLIGEAYTPAYEINADLEKMIGSMSVYTIYNGYNLAYNALSPTNAEEQIPIGYVVPTVGEYTWALDESSNVEDIEHIYLHDYETSVITDLLTDVYTFTASEQKSDTRFAINVTLKSKDSTVTGLVNVNKDREQSVKFIYNDKIYILHNGVIYDATGKFVETINK